MIYLTWQNAILIFCLGGVSVCILIYMIYIFARDETKQKGINLYFSNGMDLSMWFMKNRILTKSQWESLKEINQTEVKKEA